ncbi:MAG: hypothetical protein FJ315_08450 [SAR202 cluster bacterium]|nr:hypothetical protein [SAR202 cluster bacterium]
MLRVCLTQDPQAIAAGLEGFYHQVLKEGFFHADPHPGNMKWWNDRVYLLDLGMVGCVEPEVRELLLLLLLAFSQRDAPFLSEIVLMLAGRDQEAGEVDVRAFQEELARLIERYRGLSLREIQLGPLFQEITDISVRHSVRLPASLALAGKAFAQMQSAVTELDPALDPFSVASSFVLRNTIRELAGGLDPGKLFYEFQKGKTRVFRLLEAIEGLTEARPRPKLQINFRGTEPLERTIGRAGRRLSLALGASAALIGVALAAQASRVPLWGVTAIGAVGALLAALLVIDLLRSR